ncbi:MAG: hypothetical protein C7B43_18715 [Sulfobacillus benefaciens]|uniref:Metalloprotease TldD/E C-terminal domain-containing protein n=1 Tax=Sulfobacillus benefaciens TaxID=453960 RepID=A0A2T2WQU5_9FIRM|nr:MAG: hypothetical protein C7B43_18715 [Sulfobacillus benefaciens]
MTSLFDEPSTPSNMTWNQDDNGEAVGISLKTWTFAWQTGESPRLQYGEQYVRQVRLIHEGKLGSAISRSASWADMKAQAFEASALGPASQVRFRGSPRPLTSPPSDDPPRVETLLEWVGEVRQALSFLPSTARVQASVRFSRQLAERATPPSAVNYVARQFWSAALSARNVQGTDFVELSRSSLGESCPPHTQITNDIQTRWQWSQKTVSIPDGRYPIVFLPPVVMSLMVPVLSRLTGPNLIARNSPWEDAMNQSVTSMLLTITSDPTLAGGPRSGPEDDEGNPASIQPLIENGILRSFVLDELSADELGYSSPKMGYRPDINQLPQGAPASMVITPGDHSLIQMLNMVPRCLILGNWIGGRSTNPVRGDIAGNASELYYVEHGEVLGRVKNTVVSVNAFSALQDQLMAIGREQQWVPPSMLQSAPAYLPPILFDSVAVAGKGQ